MFKPRKPVKDTEVSHELALTNGQVKIAVALSATKGPQEHWGMLRST